MVGVEHNFLVAVMCTVADLPEVLHKSVRTRILNAKQREVVSLLEIPLGVVSVRICARALRISGDTVRILQPPCVCKICLGQEQSGNVLCQGSCQTRYVRKVIHRGLEIREDSPCVHLGHCVAH